MGKLINDHRDLCMREQVSRTSQPMEHLGTVFFYRFMIQIPGSICFLLFFLSEFKCNRFLFGFIGHLFIIFRGDQNAKIIRFICRQCFGIQLYLLCLSFRLLGPILGGSRMVSNIFCCWGLTCCLKSFCCLKFIRIFLGVYFIVGSQNHTKSLF